MQKSPHKIPNLSTNREANDLVYIVLGNKTSNKMRCFACGKGYEGRITNFGMTTLCNDCARVDKKINSKRWKEEKMKIKIKKPENEEVMNIELREYCDRILVCLNGEAIFGIDKDGSDAIFYKANLEEITGDSVRIE